jgi:hypothetical protein
MNDRSYGIVRFMRRYVAPAVLTAVLGGAVGGGGAYVIHEERDEDAAVQIMSKDLAEARREIVRAVDRLGRDEPQDPHLEPGPHGPCLCVAKTLSSSPPGFVRCSLSSECDTEAIKKCEAALQMRCGPLVAD